MTVFTVFVLFNTCSMNLIHEWNSLLKKKNKKIIFIFFKHTKNDWIFLYTQFFLSQKKIWSFIKPKPFFLNFQKQIWYIYFFIKRFWFVKIDLIFLSLTNQFFLSSQKQIWFFINQMQFVSTHNNKYDFFKTKKRMHS